MSKQKVQRKTREKQVLDKRPIIFHPAFATAWKEGDPTIRCTFFEATGRTDCPFHRIKGVLGYSMLGPIWLYAAKRTKYGIRGRYRRKNGRRSKR